MLPSWLESQDSSWDGLVTLEASVWLLGAASLLLLLDWDLPLLLEGSTCACRLFHKHVEVSSFSLATISSASFSRSCSSSRSFQLALDLLLPAMVHQHDLLRFHGVQCAQLDGSSALARSLAVWRRPTDTGFHSWHG